MGLLDKGKTIVKMDKARTSIPNAKVIHKRRKG
jgi:hypothetical protein